MRYPITKFLEGHGQWWYVNAVFNAVWDEFDYRVDVCRVTQGAHIEGLRLTHEKLGQLPLLTV
jgi:hypothetical protein